MTLAIAISAAILVSAVLVVGWCALRVQLGRHPDGER